MRYVILIMLFVSFSFSPAKADSEQTDLGLHILSVTPKQVAVVVKNISKENVRVWEDWNSWGAGHWRILILSGNKYQLSYQSGDGDWTRNGPSYRTLVPGESFKEVLNLDVGTWIRQGDKGIAMPGENLVVSYDVAPTDEARNLGVWYGVVTALYKSR